MTEKRLNLIANLQIEASHSSMDGQKPRNRRFSMTAYTGGPLTLAGWRYPVVVDLAGLAIGDKSRPIFVSHSQDVDDLLGQTDQIEIRESNLIASGEVLGDSARVQRVIALADKGFHWQASIGARAEQVEFIKEGNTITVNGRQCAGPVNIARKAVLGEISFVTMGADSNTSATIAAGKDNEDTTMDNQSAVQDVKDGAKNPETAMDVKAAAATVSAIPDSQMAIQQVRSEALAETQRIAAIRKVCNGHHTDLEAKAITEGWDQNRTELEVLRTERPKVPAVRAQYNPCSGQVLEAAAMMTGGISGDHLLTVYGQQAVETAGQRFRGGIGLQELLLEAAWANGYTGRNFRDSREVLRFAFSPNIQAGFSTINIGGILSSVANKFLLEGFFSVERTWRNICAIRNVSDFKTVTSYRLIGADQYEKVAPGGELKHGNLGEESYTNKADTFGLLLSMDRRDIINDDLGAITTVPRKLGRGSGLKINDEFWTIFLANSGFFKTDNKNYLSGADTALGIDGLTKAEVAFLDQVDSDGKPIGVMPVILLVPTGLSAIGTQLNKSLEIRDTTASVKYPIANPHQGKFRTEVSRYLANSKYTGYSAKAWYLLADPADLPVIEVAFLNGQESPTIETAEADFNVLGVQMRGYHDFGVALQDPRGGTKAKGEA